MYCTVLHCIVLFCNCDNYTNVYGKNICTVFNAVLRFPIRNPAGDSPYVVLLHEPWTLIVTLTLTVTIDIDIDLDLDIDIDRILL